jgi:hypothetical protein
MDVLATRLLAPTLAAPLREHIDAVATRVRRAAGTPTRVLRIAALVHEEAIGHLPAVLRKAGLSAHAAPVTAIVGGFGEVWKARDAAGVVGYEGRHREHLASLLLFELAHEGAPTAEMRAAARRGGLGEEFETWVRRLGAAAGEGGSV